MDWNNDGRDDLIMGNVYGNVYYFKRTGGGIHDLTTIGALFKTNGDSLDVGLRSTPFVTDWNNDGKLDLIIGSQTKAIMYYQNTGTASNPAFLTGIKLKSGGDFLKHASCRPTVYDLNGDGKKDLLISFSTTASGRVYFYENKGTDAKPVFNGYKELLNLEGLALFKGSYVNVWPVDWNGDNLTDFISCSSSGKVYVCYAVKTDISDTSSEVITPSMEISVAANPARNNFAVRLANPGESVDITVYDSSGRIVGSRAVNDRSELVIIQATGLPAGVYTVMASDANSVSSCRVALVN